MWLRVLLLLLLQSASAQAVTFVATVSSGGVNGTVTFSQANLGDAVAVTFSLAGPNRANASTWQLHTFRLNYDVSDRCSVAQLGARILNTVGGLLTDGSVSGMELSGPNSIEGRSIALLKADGTPLACATIESASDYVTASATFRQGVLGHVVFRQLTSSATALTRVTADLYSDGSESVNKNVEWRVVEGAGCSSVGTAYTPVSATGTCSNTNQASCAVGDLTGKLGTVTVGVTMGTSRMTAADLNLPLSGTSSVVEKTLQLFASGQTTPLACAVIHAFATRTGVATFDNDGVTGNITLTQRSPLDPTMTQVDLTNLGSQAGGYHVHSWPVPQRVDKDQSMCSGASVSGHFNPFNVVYDASSPAAGASTEDMYEVGDLSRKYGLLNGKDALSETYTDFNLPLFGFNSVMGRSIVIHKDETGGPRWVCVNIRDTAALTYALATFTFPVIGHVLLQQRMGESLSETSVYVELDYGDGSTTATTGHSWAVHANLVNDDMLSTDVSTRCVSAGDIFNPTTVSSSNYNTQCQPSDPLRCELGDLKAKHGGLSVRGAGGSSPARAFFTDVNLPLQGVQSVVGKSLVLKGASGSSQNLACANVLKVWPRQAEARAWGDTQYGTVTFSQQVGVVQEPTTIELDLRSITAPSSYYVGTAPVASSGERCANLTGAFNPFEVTTTGTTKDQMPVGDLSGKFGALTGPTVSRTDLDPSLDLWGPRGVVGRALTMTSSGSNLACADITNKVSEGGMTFTAKAEFTGEVTGSIMLTQVVYPNGAMTPTTVIVDLRMASGTQTQNHNWHTHVNVVGNDATASTGRCASTGGHYNPFRVNVTNNYAECRMPNPLRCELGDQSNKLGTYDMNSGPMVAADVYLPLSGKQGVIGRSIVVHAPNRGAPRLACADILPADLTHSLHLTIATPQSLDKASLISQIATAINTGTYNLAAKWTSGNEGGCIDVRVYFLGMEAAQLKEALNTLIGGKDHSALGIYKPVTCDAVVSVASLVLLLASLVFGRLLA